MTAWMQNGDYVLHGCEMIKVGYLQALQQTVQLLLRLPREKYYPDKNFGSFLYALNAVPFEDQLLALARQALADVDGVFVRTADINGGQVVFTMLLNGEERQVRLSL